MKRGSLVTVVPILALATACVLIAQAQPTRKKIPPPASSATFGIGSGPTNVKAHVGTDYATRLINSPHDPDERIRGIQRAAAMGTPEAIALLNSALEKQTIKADPRALIEIARGLAHHADQDRARAGLLQIVNVASPALAARVTPVGPRTSDALQLDEGDPVARADLARQIAAIAIARSGAERAHESLYNIARQSMPGREAALVGLAAFPPRDPGFFGASGATLPPPIVRLLGQLGDLRALDVLHAAARSSDVGIRSAALISLGELGDDRAIALSRTAIAESDARLRAAAGEAFVLLGAGERFKATSALVSDEATTAIGIRLAERVHSAEITKLVAARAHQHPLKEIRLAAIAALGRSPDEGAANALVASPLLGDKELAYYAMLALARSPAPNAMSLIAGAMGTSLKPLAVRAYVVRALGRGKRDSTGDAAIEAFARSGNANERALGVFARVALGDANVESFMDDKEPRVRRAAAMGTLAHPTRDGEHAMVVQKRKEQDLVTRQVLGIGLIGGDPEGTLATSLLIDRAESGGGDAAVAAYALARRADDTTARKVQSLLASKDPVLRAHAARGLAVASLPDATGRLANAYAYETDVDVRRAIIGALAARTRDAGSPSRKQTLENAAAVDPDAAVRQAAKRALAGVTAPFAPPPIVECAWLRITLENGSPPGEAYTASVLRSDGVSVPIVFDDEGYALVPGLSPGASRVVLAPRLPTYKTSTP